MFLPTSLDKKSIMFLPLLLITTNEVRKIFVIAVYNLGGALQRYTMIRETFRFESCRTCDQPCWPTTWLNKDRLEGTLPFRILWDVRKRLCFSGKPRFSRRLTRFETSIFGIRDFGTSNDFFWSLQLWPISGLSLSSAFANFGFDKGKERKFLMDCVNKIWLLSFIFGQEYHIVLSWRH